MLCTARRLGWAPAHPWVCLLQALDSEDPFDPKPSVPDDVKSALRWSAAHSAQEAMDRREEIMQAIEEAAVDLRQRGDCDRWLGSAAPMVRRLSEKVHGPLLELLAKQIGYDDAECIDMFRDGARLVAA